jgi:hypothetical protein
MIKGKLNNDIQNISAIIIAVSVIIIPFIIGGGFAA